MRDAWNAALASQPVHHDALTDEAMIAEAMRIGDEVVEAIGSKNGRGTIVSALHEIAKWARDHGAVHHDADALAERLDNAREKNLCFRSPGVVVGLLREASAALRSKTDSSECRDCGTAHWGDKCPEHIVAERLAADSSDALADEVAKIAEHFPDHLKDHVTLRDAAAALRSLGAKE